ncbi:hypothetical protein [Pseudopontixanthobacter vadosimaris]|uniref:hypothetical protein n=1 Tax=Pseudopontixanthobacter vadosimaris TaxID=2726450 RepID=UPI001F0E5CD4|nr:hypothetical protein [Pseudopontixanthobacter vadosimaris]
MADPRDPHRPSLNASRSTRAIAAQGTSATAFPGDVPGDDDPLLGFAPYLHARPRSNSITPDLQRRFVATLAATGIVRQAARSIGKSLEALYKLRARPGAEGFSSAWDAALERGMQRLEDCALERALAGEERPIVSGGKLLGTWVRHDNALLRFLLQHRMPERYGIQNLRPGHPLYESIRAEVLAQHALDSVEDEDAVFASIDAKLDAMIARQRSAAEYARGDCDFADGSEDAAGLIPPSEMPPAS